VRLTLTTLAGMVPTLRGCEFRTRPGLRHPVHGMHRADTARTLHVGQVCSQ